MLRFVAGQARKTCLGDWVIFCSATNQRTLRGFTVGISYRHWGTAGSSSPGVMDAYSHYVTVGNLDVEFDS